MCPFALYYVVLVSVLKPFKRIITHLPELMMHVGHKTLKVTINDQRDVESPLQRSSAVLYHHRVEPRILFTNILNLQSVVEVDLNLFHLKLRAMVYLLALFKPAQTHTLEQPRRQMHQDFGGNLPLPLRFRRGEGRHIHL